MVDEYAGADQQLDRIAAVGRELSAVEGLEPTLARIVALGEDLLRRCDGASLMLVGRGGVIQTPASSSSVAYESDMAQYATGQGPCLNAIREHETIVLDDLERDERWPDYRARVLRLGVRSMLSCRLFVTGDSLGALNLYSRTPDAFDGPSVALGQVFAAQASVAMKAALIEEGLRTAIASRDVIGQAKGIVMARRRLTADMAFDVLKRLSQDRNQKLTLVAEHIARTGELPD